MFSDEINDAWMLKVVHDDVNELSDFEEDENLINDTLSINEVVITCEYHIAYSVSYSCPVLCFNVWKSNGSLLTIDECWEMFNISAENQYDVLTQMDHPVLGKPFATLHPCKTAELMGILGNSRNIVVSWLSTVGRTVGLNVPPDYAKLTY
ncbi:hypothetical protein FQA39_LY15597 [Lamprigera yunnana]|nr:hypothetical protein FQA39_LY15597 [Lamprigera yunnana]